MTINPLSKQLDEEKQHKKEVESFNQSIRLTVKLLNLFEERDLIQGPAISAALSVLVSQVMSVMGNRKNTEIILRSILEKTPEPLDKIDSRDEYFNDDSQELH
jgi:hypothetical protein|tara:strand:+ start:295 stop:603 length:309 start_codon:yes stop_codon:yes gene_type:complete